MINAMQSLAFSMQSNPAVYALLLGSGVSRSANIPTGWEITLDLVRKLAATTGKELNQKDAEQWYLDAFQKAPDYSELLNTLAKTQTERQQLVRGYIEPSEEERANGQKLPTPAHHAIAKLVAKGFIRVIITTNFDRLMEQALEAIGITPTVISSEDLATGTIPLSHQRCCVLKVHGDYMDTRIRNTETELASYPDAIDKLLDQIFDEFGLITCGWSAAWDPALRKAIERATARRYSQYWAIRDQATDEAIALMKHRGADQIPIADADTFFATLAEQIEALEKISRQAPKSIAAKVAILKKYLPDPVHRISLDDLINDEVNQILEETSTLDFAFTNCPPPNTEAFTHRVRAYEAACEGLMAMAAVGGYWSEDWHHSIWQKALVRLAYIPSRPTDTSSYPTWRHLRRYPATLLLYALGLSALQAGEKGISLLAALLSTSFYDEHAQRDQTAIEALPPVFLFQESDPIETYLEGMNKESYPLNEWLLRLFHPLFIATHPSRKTFQTHFDRLEVLIALHYLPDDPNERHKVPLGNFSLEHIWRMYLDPHLQALRASLNQHGENSIYLKTKLIGTSPESAESRMTQLAEIVGRGVYRR